MPNHDSDSQISFELQIVENDSRSKQFACKVVIGNHTQHAVDLIGLNYRLGRGVSMQMNDDNSFVDLKDEYDTLRSHVRLLITSAFLNSSEKFRAEYANNFLEALRNQFSVRTVSLTYFYLATGRFKTFRKAAENHFNRMDFPISSASDAKTAAAAYADQVAGIKAILEAKTGRRADIEAIDRNFLRPEYITQLQPNESYERVYVLKATRRFASVASYSLAFDAKLRWPESTDDAARTVERIISRATSFNVTPSPITLSVYAIIFSIIGVLLATLPNFQGDYKELFSLAFVKQYFVGGALAVVVYNSLEMTEFADRVRSISWRSAMFIGVLCGLLSDRMLHAITAFVK